MKQMVAPEAMFVGVVFFGSRSLNGFFRLKKDSEGKIYFAGIDGKGFFCYVVLEGGTISVPDSGRMVRRIRETEVVEIIMKEDLGIDRIVFTTEQPTA